MILKNSEVFFGSAAEKKKTQLLHFLIAGDDISSSKKIGESFSLDDKLTVVDYYHVGSLPHRNFLWELFD